MKIGWRSPSSSRDIYLSINLEVNELAVVIWEHFFRAYRASSNWHEGVSENSRQLNKLQTQLRVYKNFKNSSNPRVFRWGYINTEKVLYIYIFLKNTRESKTSQPCFHALIS